MLWCGRNAGRCTSNPRTSNVNNFDFFINRYVLSYRKKHASYTIRFLKKLAAQVQPPQSATEKEQPKASAPTQQPENSLNSVEEVIEDSSVNLLQAAPPVTSTPEGLTHRTVTETL